MDNNSTNENPLAKYFARAKPKPKDSTTTIPPVAPETSEQTPIVAPAASAAVEPSASAADPVASAAMEPSASATAVAAPPLASQARLETLEPANYAWPRSARQMSDMLLANVGSRKRPAAEESSGALHSRDASDFGYAPGDKTEASAEKPAENVDEAAAEQVASPSWRVVGR